MKLIPTKPRIYFSHSIRGNGSIPAEENCERAVKAGNKVRKCFPDIELFIPGEHDLAMQLLVEKKALSIYDILLTDLRILRNCHNWCWWFTGLSDGCHIEEMEAENLGWVDSSKSENIIYTDLLKANFSEIRRVFTPIVEQAIKRFRK